jgi:hypothetical protein
MMSGVIVNDIKMGRETTQIFITLILKSFATVVQMQLNKTIQIPDRFVYRAMLVVGQCRFVGCTQDLR